MASIKWIFTSAIAAYFLFALETSYAAAAEDVRSRKPVSKIIDGTFVPQGKWPFIVAIAGSDPEVSVWQQQFCGGSFIGDRYVLTAAHCVIGLTPGEIIVVIGVEDLTSQQAEQNRIPVRTINIHPEYNDLNLKNDIAVLELQSSQNLAAVPLATPADLDALSLGDNLTAMGWGNQQPDSNLLPIYPDSLFEVELPYVSRTACQQQGGDYAQIGEETICAGYGLNSNQQGDTCQGDSGGPLVAGNASSPVLVGMTSWGDGCGQDFGYGAYTNVAHFAEWVSAITSNIQFVPYQDLGFLTAGTYQHSFSLANEDSFPIEVRSVSVFQSNVSNVNIQSDSCSVPNNSGFALVAGANCEVVVEFTASQEGESEIEVSFETNHPQAATLSSLARAWVLGAESSTIASHVDSALDNWFSNDFPWRTQNTDITMGNTGLRAGMISHNQQSVLAVNPEGTGTLSFDFRVSSEEFYDFFEVFVGDSLVLSRSGIQADFVKHEISLPETNSSVFFIYSKDGSVSDGADTVYLDNILFTADTPVPPAVDDGTDTFGSSGTGGGSIGIPLLLLLSLGFFTRQWIGIRTT